MHEHTQRHPYTRAYWLYVPAGIAQWLERRTRDWKVAGSNPCWSGGRIFFSRVKFLCWLLFRYPFHPRVTAVARKRSRSFCQKCRWQVTAKHAYTLRMWILLNRASALVTTCPYYVKWHLRTLSINSSSSSSINTKLNLHNLKRKLAANRLETEEETDEDSSRERKTWQV